MRKKIVAFAGSTSSQSINRELVKYALKYLDGFEQELLDLNDFDMPIFSVDKEKKGFPAEAYLFRKKMQEADAIVCSITEHNRSYTAAFKNVLDWCSRMEDMAIFANKPMLLMSASTGAYAAGNAMNLAKGFFPRCSAKVIETFSLPTFQDNFSEGEITNDVFRVELLEKIRTFQLELAH
jgi:chromate reductase, NAD(P)H dehydrogenase (quinone)